MTLPQRLRRYLRAFLGNPGLADEAMLDALERLVGRGEAMTPIGAFRAAHRTAMRMPPALRLADDEPMRLGLAALPGGTRAAFLLLRLEQFGPAEAAEIMDISTERVIEEARAAALDIQRLLVPVGGTALITDPDQITALDLAHIAADVGFAAIREPDPTARILQGCPGPFLIICEAVRRDRGDAAALIADIAGRCDAAVLCVTASSRAQAFLDHVPGAQLLRKPFETAAAIRTILDVVAGHRVSRLAVRFEGKG